MACINCGPICIKSFMGKFHPNGERMIKSFHCKNYSIVWDKLNKNSHYLLYKGGIFNRNILRCAIFRCNSDFVERLIKFGKKRLSQELYEEWINDDGGYYGCYYTYPIYIQDIKMIKLLIKLEIPFKSTIILKVIPFINRNTSHQTTEKKLEILELLLKNGADPNGHAVEKVNIVDFTDFTFSRCLTFDFWAHPDASEILTLLCKYGFDFDRGVELILYEDIFISDLGWEVDKEKIPLAWLYLISFDYYEDIDKNVNLFPIFLKNLSTIFLLYFSKKYKFNLKFINFERQICEAYYKNNCNLSIFEYKYGTDYRTSTIYKIVQYYITYIELVLIFKGGKLLPLNIWNEIYEYLQ